MPMIVSVQKARDGAHLVMVHPDGAMELDRLRLCEDACLRAELVELLQLGLVARSLTRGSADARWQETRARAMAREAAALAAGREADTGRREPARSEGWLERIGRWFAEAHRPHGGWM